MTAPIAMLGELTETASIRRTSGLAIFVAAVAVGLAVCGDSDSARVVSIGNGSAGGDGSTASTGSRG